ncbi:MAG: endonuclease/exonuclease/phosphatase family protein [Bacteroidota bacterium]
MYLSLKKTYLFSLLLCIHYQSAAQDRYWLKTIAFYNVENLFDTIDQADVRDEEFLPEAARQWNTERYQLKLTHNARVIADIGVDPKLGITEPPVIIGLCEVENKQVVEDLMATVPLNQQEYGVCHFDSPDRRGIDVALAYNKKYFTPTAQQSRRLHDPKAPDFITRDQLVVTGKLEGDLIHVVVNHWPSRRGGEKRSEPRRLAAAQLTRSIVDSLVAIDPQAKIFVMGDLNDTPVNNSLTKVLKAKGNTVNMKEGELFNPMVALHKKGYGTLAYRDVWQIFDQIIITPTALSLQEGEGYHYFPNTARIFDKKYVKNSKGKYAGYPHRTYVGSSFKGGYSDHLPVYIYVAKKAE